jgi:hypothetical protein
LGGGGIPPAHFDKFALTCSGAHNRRFLIEEHARPIAGRFPDKWTVTANRRRIASWFW